MSFWVRIEVAPEGLPPRGISHKEDGPPGFESRTTRVWSGLPLIPLGTRGCIAGYLFRRESPCGRVIELDDAVSGQAIATRGASLIADYWGGYVAVIECDDGGIDVIRDPSGLLPCYVRCGNDMTHLASDMTALVAPGTAKVDFDVIARMFASIDALGRKTAIVGVNELLAGERMRLNRAGAFTSLAWSPWDYIPRRYGWSFDESVEALRTTVKQSVGAWATCFDSILLGVSGGVDSSIVAAAAMPRTPVLRLLTLVESGSEGDERRYAEALAARLGRRLAAPLLDLDAVDVAQPALPHFPVPLALPLMQAVEAIHRGEEQFKPIDAFFSGNGGDNVFCNMHSAAPLADRLIARGPTLGAWRTARDLADLTSSPIAAVVRHGWRRLRDRRIRRIHQEDFCQALGIAPENKYAIEGGPGFAACFDLVRRTCTMPARDLLRLLDAAIFNAVIGNADAHGKNFSLLYGDEATVLAPLYDLMVTAYYPEVATRFAMPIGRANQLEALDARAWEHFAADMELAVPFVRRRVHALTTRIRDAAPAVADILAGEGCDPDILSALVALVAARAGTISGVL